MGFSEILLRLGSHLVGWLIIYSHLIWVAVIPQISCGPEGEELFRLSLGFSPLVIVASLMLGLAKKLETVVEYLRWLALPLILLFPLAIKPVLTALETTTFGGLGLCEPVSATFWQQAWAPVQIVAIIFILVASVLFILKTLKSTD
jgi:hypothetical protein